MVNLIIGRVVWLFNISLSVFITYYWLYQMKLKQLNDTISLSNERFNIQLFYKKYIQIDCWQQATAILSIYMLAHFYLKSILLTIHQTTKWPALQKLIKCLGFIIRNLILYTLILGFLLAYILIQKHQSTFQSKNYQDTFPILQILEMFILARIIFSFGFIFGTLTGFQDFRAQGMGLTIGAIAVTLAQVNHINLLSYF